MSRKVLTMGPKPRMRSTIPPRSRLRQLSSAVPSALRSTLPFVVWTLVSIVFGLFFGLAAVILPPAGAFGIVAIAALVLLAAMPDLHRVPTKAVRATFFIMLVVSLTIPAYYTLVIPGVPWISIRRVATFALIIVFAITMGGSVEQRKNIRDVIAGSKILAMCFIGYLVMTLAATILSRQISTSTSDMTEIILAWYVPLLATIFVINTDDDVFLILKVVCYTMIIVALFAIYDFVFRKHFYLDILPHTLLTMVLNSSPLLAANLGTITFRNGLPRASSVYMTPLSLAEFGAIVAPITYFFIFYGKTLIERWLGIVTAILCLIAIFCSGSRGGYNSLFVGTVTFIGVSLIRKQRFDSYNLMPAIGGVVAIISFTALVALIFLWTRLHNMVLGGGMEAYSDSGRYAQWAMGIPKIVKSPVWGYGLGTSADVVGWISQGGLPSIDSFALTALVETGIPGFVFYAGMIVVSIWFGIRESWSNPERPGAVAGALACSLVAYGFYRLFLSQRENQLLFFVIVGLVMWLMSARSRAEARQPAPMLQNPVAQRAHIRTAVARAPV